MKTKRTTVHRAPSRGNYDSETIYRVLDRGFLCHIAFVHENSPICIPTLFGREGDTLYVHGSIASRLIHSLKSGLEICLTITHVDGLILAKSAFHHSMNYESVVIIGKANLVTDEKDKNNALKVISDQILKGRWEECREPNENELKATDVLAIKIEEASCKIRSGGPNEDAKDMDLPYWSGEIPIQAVYQTPIPSNESDKEMGIPQSVIRKMKE